MSKGFTIKNFDFKNIKGLVSPRKQLDLEGVAIGLIGLSSNEGYSFTHSHREQEEVYIVIEGSGYILLGGDLVEIKRGDIVRVACHVRRALKAGEDGVTVICAGGIPAGYPKNPNARYLIDDGVPYYDDIPPWYEGNHMIIKKNSELALRMQKKRKE